MSNVNIDRRGVDFSKYVDYVSFSDGYYWMDYESMLAVTETTNNMGVEDALNDPFLWNRIGISLFNMPYVEINGEYDFIVPVYSDSVESDVERQSMVGDIIEAFTKTDEYDISFSSKTSFMLYNNKIVVENIEDEDDANIANIVFNIITVFLLQTLRRGQ